MSNDFRFQNIPLHNKQQTTNNKQQTTNNKLETLNLKP
jgi:hypothetical protein